MSEALCIYLDFYIITTLFAYFLACHPYIFNVIIFFIMYMSLTSDIMGEGQATNTNTLHIMILQNCLVRDNRILASSPGHSQILSRSRGEKSGEGLGSKLGHRPEMVDSVSA